MAQSHLDLLARHATDRYGPQRSDLWMASLDLQTLSYPESQPVARAGPRVYRDIASPRGSNIYWDIPQLVAACALGGAQRSAAERYVQAFLQRGVDRTGLFVWGNHRYWDAYRDQPATFARGPHEMRPIPPCWDVFWSVDPVATERQIRQAAQRHIYDPGNGAFNRHDDSKPGHAFIEVGGILAESLCWLYRKTGDTSLADLALQVARFSHSHRSAKTGLIENEPVQGRWDKFVSTTEVGLWAGSLLRAADHSGREEFVRMADDGVSAFLRHGFDRHTGRYYGQLRVADGTPVLKAQAVPGPQEYWPGNHADVWNANFPAHDYPMAMAQACCELYRRTPAERFGEAIARFAGAVQRQELPVTARNGRGGYAELYGRIIHFLARAAEVTGETAYRRQAEAMAGEAVARLHVSGMFRGHLGEDRYDAVDGVGYLLLALLYLEAGERADYRGFGF